MSSPLPMETPTKGAKVMSNEDIAEKQANDNHPLAIMWRKASYWWSTVLLIFCLFVLYYDICQDWVNDFDDNARGSESADDTHPAVNFVVFTLLICWVALLEGAQVSIVGLKSTNIEHFKDTHPRSYAVCKWVHDGPNTERFIVGRQFLLLFLVFILTRVSGHSKDRVDLETNNGDMYIGDWNWNNESSVAFMDNSILLMIVVIVPGQLISQLIAAGKMLDFLELPYAPMYTVVWPSMALEWLGFTHTSYVLKDIFVWISGVELDDDKTRMTKDWFYWLRAIMSVVLVIFAMIVVMQGTADEVTNVWETLPPYGAILLSWFFLFFIGCCEGFQIAAVKLAKIDSKTLQAKYPWAFRINKTMATGRNFQAFLMGRQVFVAMMMVLLAKVTSFGIKEDGCNVVNGTKVCEAQKEWWGFEEWAIDAFLNTGILGAVFVVNVGQLSFRMLASCFPEFFINNIVLYSLLRTALFVEATGVVNSAWPLTWAIEGCLKLKSDDTYLSTDDSTLEKDILKRKASLAIPVAHDADGNAITPFNTHQPESQIHQGAPVNGQITGV